MLVDFQTQSGNSGYVTLDLKRHLDVGTKRCRERGASSIGGEDFISKDASNRLGSVRVRRRLVQILRTTVVPNQRAE